MKIVLAFVATLVALCHADGASGYSYMPPPPEIDARTIESAEPRLTLRQGELKGVVLDTLKGRKFNAYQRIPFARPPVGNLRFKDPLPASKWTGILDATLPPPLCSQLDFVKLLTMGMPEPVGEEDCLYLNVFTPTGSPGRRSLPVMVFIHGGGFWSGASVFYGPKVLMDEEIILVTIQYRVGTLGFLSTEDSNAPGNLALKDQTLALQWIQDNIAMFGGDPSRVTIFGQSAGAGSVHLHMMSPKSKGLFSSVIMMSGGSTCAWAVRDDHAKVAIKVAEIMQCPSTDPRSIVECLQNRDANDLQLALASFFRFGIGPGVMTARVDGSWLPDLPDKLIASGRYTKVPMVSGTVTHEGGIVSYGIYAFDQIRQLLNTNFNMSGPDSLLYDGDAIDPSKELEMVYATFNEYAGSTMATLENSEEMTQMFGDRVFTDCEDVSSMAHSMQGLTVYRYKMAHRGKTSVGDAYQLQTVGQNWVTHMDDLQYLFDTPFFFPMQDPTDLSLRDTYVKLWTNFAAKRNPTPDNSLGFTWMPTTRDNQGMLVILPQPVMSFDDTYKKQRDFWRSLPLRVNKYLSPQTITSL